MKLKLTLPAAALCLSMSLAAQTSPSKRDCGSEIPGDAWNSWFNKKVEEHKQAMTTGKTQATTYVIPVIVHVIHSGQNVGTSPNISQAQVNSQITVLNADFSGTGYNVGNVPAAFSSLVADCDVSFCLAKTDPDGNTLAEPGIDRVNYNTIPGGSNPAVPNNLNAFKTLMDNTIKPATIWDPTMYFNIWVSEKNAQVSILGYATFPAGTGLPGLSGVGSASDDGIWIWARSFGSTGTLDFTYNKGRTATHETGHWLGLRHVWGDANCGNDYCGDTPTQQQENYGCMSYPHVTCSNGPTGDMFMNFMDYSDDNCLYMFTPDQRTRIQTTMINGTYRNQLTASSETVCNTYSAPTATFGTSGAAGCMNEEFTMDNESSGTPVPTYSWTSSSVAAVFFNPDEQAASPTLQFNAPGTYTITLTATNAGGSTVVSKVITIDNCTVGLEKRSLLDKAISLAPNPSSGLLTIKTSLATSQNIDIKIHNTLGQQISASSYSNVTNNEFNLDLGQYPDGIYIVTIDNGTERLNKRLIIQK